MKKALATFLTAATMLAMASAFPVSAASHITVDGDISDWEGYNYVSIVGSGDHEGKSAKWYAKLAEDGLYLAVEAYHDILINNGPSWHESTNFEVFFGDKCRQAWVSAQGMDTKDTPSKSDNVTSAAMVVTQLTDAATNYYSVSEMFITKEQLTESGYLNDNLISVGLAWKTIGDKCNNGGNDGGAAVDWWGPAGARTNYGGENNTFICRASSDGVYAGALKGETVELFGRDSTWYYAMGPDTTGGTATAPEGWPTSIDKTVMAEGNLPAESFWKPGENPNDGTQANAYLWLAKEFTVEDPDDFKGMGLFSNMNFDDDVAIYINGIKVYYHSRWNGNAADYLLTDDAAGILKEGTNVIAVSLHQHHGGANFNGSLFAAPIKEVEEPADPVDPPVTDETTDPVDPPATDETTDPVDPPATDETTDPVDPPATDEPATTTTKAPVTTKVPTVTNGATDSDTGTADSSAEEDGSVLPIVIGVAAAVVVIAVIAVVVIKKKKQ